MSMPLVGAAIAVPTSYRLYLNALSCSGALMPGSNFVGVGK
jgi:hypothetical protein